jgi:RNA polymerase sigma-70 factor (ECF subfamily)
MRDLRTPEGFAAFYREHAGPLTGFFMRRTGDAEVAADLVAETFAAALGSTRRYDPAQGPAVAWLYGIARNQLGLAQRRGRVEDRARRRLGMEPLQLTDLAIERVEAHAAAEGTAHALRELLDGLPPDQRAAVEARVVDERDYAEIATAAETSETVIRQRVSRGLSRLRSGMKGGAL